MADKFNSDIIIISGAVLSAILVYYAGSVYGPGLTFDSVNYLYAGVSLAEKGKLIRPQQQPYIQWPPLYPAIIALLNCVSGNLLKAIFYFQIVVTFITVWLSGKLLQQLIRNKLIFIAAYSAFVFSSPVILVNHFVWSESVFVCIVLIYIQLLSIFLQKPSVAAGFMLILAGNLLCLQRLAGVYFIVGAFFLLLLYPYATLNLNKLLRVCLLGAASVLSLFAWWMFNVFVNGNFLDGFVLIKKSHLQHFLDFNHVFTSWFLPQLFPVWLRIILVYTVIGFLLFMHGRERKNKATISAKAEVHVNVLFCLFSSYFVLLYMSINGIDVLDDRILAPAYIPGMLLFFGLLDRYIYTINKSWKKWLLYACVLWTIYPVIRTIHNLHIWHHLPVQPPIEQPVEAEFLEKLIF